MNRGGNSPQSEKSAAKRTIVEVVAVLSIRSPFAFVRRVDVVAVREAPRQRLPHRREATGGRGAREDEALEAEGLRQLEHVAEALDVRPLVLGVLLAREVVVGGEVDKDVGPAVVPDSLEDRLDRGPFADVRLVPRDVRMHRCAGAGPDRRARPTMQ
jgi:hypothetical protein